jgi:hypothetical protein
VASTPFLNQPAAPTRESFAGATGWYYSHP